MENMMDRFHELNAFIAAVEAGGVFHCRRENW